MTINTDAAIGGLLGALAATLGVAFVDELLDLERRIRDVAAALRRELRRQGVLA